MGQRQGCVDGVRRELRQHGEDVLQTGAVPIRDAAHRGRPVGLQRIEEVVGELAPFLHRHAVEPRGQGHVDPQAHGIPRVFVMRVRAVEFPAEQVMLVGSRRRAREDAGVGDARLEQSADDAERGDETRRHAVD